MIQVLAELTGRIMVRYRGTDYIGNEYSCFVFLWHEILPITHVTLLITLLRVYDYLDISHMMYTSLY